MGDASQVGTQATQVTKATGSTMLPCSHCAPCACKCKLSGAVELRAEAPREASWRSGLGADASQIAVEVHTSMGLMAGQSSAVQPLTSASHTGAPSPREGRAEPQCGHSRAGTGTGVPLTWDEMGWRWQR